MRKLWELHDLEGAAALQGGLRTPLPSCTAIFTYRDGIDLYTHQCPPPKLRQRDHCLEVQLLEYQTAACMMAHPTLRREAIHVPVFKQLRMVVNGLDNLNVTTLHINQAKRGPHTAALNRLSKDGLRVLTLEQLARQGRARWLVDGGQWARIEAGMVAACDAFLDTSLPGPASPADALYQTVLEDLQVTMGELGVG